MFFAHEFEFQVACFFFFLCCPLVNVCFFSTLRERAAAEEISPPLAVLAEVEERDFIFLISKQRKTRTGGVTCFP